VASLSLSLSLFLSLTNSPLLLYSSPPVPATPSPSIPPSAPPPSCWFSPFLSLSLALSPPPPPPPPPLTRTQRGETQGILRRLCGSHVTATDAANRAPDLLASPSGHAEGRARRGGEEEEASRSSGGIRAISPPPPPAGTQGVLAAWRAARGVSAHQLLVPLEA
jgi:hypothetical protein